MCYNGKDHKLEEIYSVDIGWNEERSVLWCRECGSVCIAKESDGRIFGYVGRMKFPNNLREYARLKEGQHGKIL